MNSGIYLITHIATGRKYVGQSENVGRRIAEHSYGNSTGEICRAVKEFGWAAFVAEVLETCDRCDLDEAEARWVQAHDCLVPNGFNTMRPTGKRHFRNTGMKLNFFISDPDALRTLDKLAAKHGGVTAAITHALKTAK